MRRTDLDDTSEQAWLRLLARLRELTPEERLAKTFDRIEAGRRLRHLTEPWRAQVELDR